MEANGIEALRRTIEDLGWSQRDVADIVGVSQPSVSYILTSGKRVPAEWCLPLERASKGDLTRHQLRPDLYPVDEDEAAL